MSSQKDQRTRIVAWAMLCVAFAAVLRAIDVMIPHPYAGRGLAIFLASRTGTTSSAASRTGTPAT